MNSDNPQPKQRRNHVIASSPNCEEYVELMRNGWTSTRLEQYALVRYGEVIPAGTFRTFKHRRKIVEYRNDPVSEKLSQLAKDNLQDPTALRSELASWLREVVAIQVTQAQTGRIPRDLKATALAYNQILNDVKQDQQDIGIMGKAGENIQLHVSQQSETNHRVTIQELVGDDPHAQMAMAKTIMGNVLAIENAEIESAS